MDADIAVLLRYAARAPIVNSHLDDDTLARAFMEQARLVREGKGRQGEPGSSS